jgi:hypothetical protein
MSLEMAHKVILPPKKNYIPQFLKQRDINSYFSGPKAGSDLFKFKPVPFLRIYTLQWTKSSEITYIFL